MSIPSLPEPPTPGESPHWAEYLARCDRLLDLYARDVEQKVEYNRLHAEALRLQSEAQRAHERHREEERRGFRRFGLVMALSLAVLLAVVGVWEAIKASR